MTPQFLNASDVAVEVMAALASILPGVKVHVAKFDGDSGGVFCDVAKGKYDIEVEAPPEVQRMFHAAYPNCGDTTHYFQSAKIMVQQMAFDYEAFRRSGTVGNGGRA